MFCHAGAASAGLCGQGFGGGCEPCGRFRRQFGAKVGCSHSCLLRGKGRDGCPCFARVSRVRACGGAGGRIAAARFVRLIARARRRTPLSSCRTRPLRHAPTRSGGRARREEDPCGNVMKCHAMSWRRSVALPSRLAGRPLGVTGLCRASGGWREPCGRFRRQLGAGIGCGHSCLLRGKGRDGRSLFCARFAGACVRGCGRAYRGGAVRARDCPRETAHAPRPSVPAGVFFAAPSRSPAQKSRKAAPGAASLLSFYHTSPQVKPLREQKLKMPEVFHEMPTVGTGGHAPLSPGPTVRALPRAAARDTSSQPGEPG